MKTMPSSVHEASIRPQRGCVSATAIIWGCSTGMVGIDLLLSTSAQSETAIATAIVVAAAASTMTVWISTQKSALTKTKESDQDLYLD